MFKRLVGFLGALVLAVFAQYACAAPFSVSYTDTITTYASLPSGVNSGEQVTTIFVLDNGGGSNLNQTWNASDVQCVIFRFNDAQNLYTAVDYSGSSFNSTSGSFATDGSGALTSAPSAWNDTAEPIVAPTAENLTGSPRPHAWYINAANDIVMWNNYNLAVGFNNVGNDTDPAYWTDPVSASGTCASYGPYAQYVAPTAINVPTLSEWGMILLSSLLALGSVFALRRLRRS